MPMKMTCVGDHMPNFSLICPLLAFGSPKYLLYVRGYEKPHPLAHLHVSNNTHPGTLETLPNFSQNHWSFN